MIPRWLQGMLAFSSAIVIVLAFLAGMALWSSLVAHGEVPFDRDQRAFLKETFPQGAFISESVYRWCEGRRFEYVDSKSRAWNNGESCLDLRAP